jgi:hypothetical protein
MAIISALLTDINLRYRNTYTDAQKVVWMNEEQQELFEMFEIESVPYSFLTVANTKIYPIPSGVELEKIKVINIQINDNNPPEFQELPYKRNDDKQEVYEWEYFYTYVQNNLFINVPGQMVGYRNVYIYTDLADSAIDPLVLSVEPVTPVKFQEILKLGTLKRIAQARKDVIMANNYSAEHDQKIEDFMWAMKMNEPEFSTPIDVMPRNGYRNTVSNMVSRG